MTKKAAMYSRRCQYPGPPKCQHKAKLVAKLENGNMVETCKDHYRQITEPALFDIFDGWENLV